MSNKVFMSEERESLTTGRSGFAVTGFEAFLPTPLEMAERHRAAGRANLALARQYGNTPKGRHYLELARANAAVEKAMREEDRLRRAARDGYLAEYRAARSIQSGPVTSQEVADAAV